MTVDIEPINADGTLTAVSVEAGEAVVLGSPPGVDVVLVLDAEGLIPFANADPTIGVDEVIPIGGESCAAILAVEIGGTAHGRKREANRTCRETGVRLWYIPCHAGARLSWPLPPVVYRLDGKVAY